MSGPIELLTLDQVAEQLQVSRRTIERLIAAGRIRPHRLGRAIRVSSRELEAYLASTRGRHLA